MQASQLKGFSLALVAVSSLKPGASPGGGRCLFHPHSVLLQFIRLLKLFFTVFPQGLTASGGGALVVAG